MRRFVCSCGVTLAVVYVFLVGSGPASGQPLQDRLEKPLSEKTPAVPKQAIDVLRTTVGELGPLFTAWMTQSVYLPPMSLRAQLPETFYKTPILPPIPPGKKHTCEEAPDQETILLCLPEPRAFPGSMRNTGTTSPPCARKLPMLSTPCVCIRRSVLHNCIIATGNARSISRKEKRCGSGRRLGSGIGLR